MHSFTWIPGHLSERCLYRYHHRRNWLVLIILCTLWLHSAAARAQGGPPFRTDDPDTPGNRHWEINFGFIGDRNPGTGAYQVPDFDINYGLGDRIQLKYELPISIEETRPTPAMPGVPATQETVITGLGESLLGVKWRYFEHHKGDSIRSAFGTGLLALFGHHDATEPTGVSGDSPGAADAPAVTGEKEPTFELGTYPQLYLDNPTNAVPRGLLGAGPNFYLPIEVSGRIGPIRYNADAGYTSATEISRKAGTAVSSWVMSSVTAQRPTSNFTICRTRTVFRLDAA